MRLILTHPKIPFALMFDASIVDRGLWLGASCHACPDCAQIKIDLLLFGFSIVVAKKMRGFDEVVAQIIGKSKKEKGRAD